MYREAVPVFVCDICNKPITDIADAAAVFRERGRCEGELHTVMHVHKGDCHDRAMAQLGGCQGDARWAELQDHLNDLMVAAGVTLRTIIDRGMVWSGLPSPPQYAKWSIS
jgi:hypothetical protein